MNKKRLSAFIFAAMVAAGGAGPAQAQLSDKRPEVIREIWNFEQPVKFRGVKYTWPSADGTSGYVLKTDGSGALSWGTVTGAGDNTLDNAYDEGGAGAGRTITADTGAVTITNTDADAAYLLAVTPTPGSSAATGGAQITSGANATQDSLNIVNAGTGDDIDAGNGAFKVSKTGAITGLSADLSGALSADGVVALGNGTGTVAINSSAWDISTAGAMTGVTSITGLTSLGIDGDITLTNGNSVKSSTTTAETILLQAYDVDNTTYRDVLTLTNGNTIAAALGSGLETVAVNSTTWDVSTAGAFTGVADITGTAGAAMTVTIASDGAADDLTLSVTGATDSSVILASAGTGTDAISLQASAGGVDIDSPAAQDTSIAGGQVAIASKDDAASAISLTANVGTSETIVVTNTKGTSESAVTLLSTAGGVNVDAAAAKDLDLAGGQVKLVSKDNAAGAISLTANIGANETISVTNTQGTNAAAIGLTATAGGVTITTGSGTTIPGAVIGSGTGTITGFLSTVADSGAGPDTLTAANCGSWFYNSQANQTNLPEASTAHGCTLCFGVLNASNYDINPDDADLIVGATNAAGDMIRSATVGDTVCLTAVSDSQWMVQGMYPAGTDWADAN